MLKHNRELRKLGWRMQEHVEPSLGAVHRILVYLTIDDVPVSPVNEIGISCNICCGRT